MTTPVLPKPPGCTLPPLGSFLSAQHMRGAGARYFASVRTKIMRDAYAVAWKALENLWFGKIRMGRNACDASR